MAAPRSIAHVDMDAFFASVEARDDPALRGLPVLVGYPGKRGVVAAASYEARAFGCRSAQPMAVALRKCPAAKVVLPRHDRYVEVSRAVFEIFARLAAEEGRAVLVVTHDADLARRANRRIHLVDGRIVSDETAAAPVA